MDYQPILESCAENAQLISMVSVEELIRFGYSIGLNENSRVLDLCCGYGTLLKIWSEAFGISGVGVDLCQEFLNDGTKRLLEAKVNGVQLVYGDVKKYDDNQRYDVVICSETIGSIENTLTMGEKFLKPRGILAYQKVYAKVDDIPQELDDFDGGVYPLPELNRIFNNLGYYVTHMASSTDSDWERYVTWSVRRDIARLRQNPQDEKLKAWIDKWYRMYFVYRRSYEGQAMFGLEKF